MRGILVLPSNSQPFIVVLIVGGPDCYTRDARLADRRGWRSATTQTDAVLSGGERVVSIDLHRGITRLREEFRYMSSAKSGSLSVPEDIRIPVCFDGSRCDDGVHWWNGRV